MKIKTISKINRSQCHNATGLVVVIDVIRAFTTAAFAFHKGAKKIIAVGTIEEALALKQQNSEYILLGEKGGYPIPGFQFGNSPVQIGKQDLKNKTLVQRTSSGTQGVVRSTLADHMLVSSFVVAEATYQRILSLNPESVTFVITGQKSGGSEDMALADYLEAKLQGKNVKKEDYLHKVVTSPCAIHWLQDKDPRMAQSFQDDLDAVVEIDRFGFALEVERQNGLMIIKPVSPDGKFLTSS